MNKMTARVASDNLLRQLLLLVVGIALVVLSSDAWLRAAGGVLVALAVIVGSTEFFARSRRHD